MRIKQNDVIREKYCHIEHPSGLDIYVIPKNHGSTYALFGTKYGSIDSCFKVDGEPELARVPDGIAHFLEHKLFEDENGVDAFKRFADTGASANAYTSFERTAYLFSCTEKFDESLEILLDFVTHPFFSEATVQKEQGIIGQEIRMYQDNPGWRVFFGLLEAMYHRHTVRLDIAGTIESIAQITPETLYRCYNTFYNLNNMALCVCGNVTAEQVTAIADKVLKKAPAINIVREVIDEPKEVLNKRVECKLAVSMPMFAIGIKDSDVGYDGPKSAQKSAEIAIINEMLFGKSGDLYTELYNQGLINAKFSHGSEANISFGFTEIAGESSDPDAVFDAIQKYIEKLRTQGLDREDFERAKRVVYANAIRVFDSTEDIANSFLSYIFDRNDMLDAPEVISRVTYEQAMKRFAVAYHPDYCAMSVVAPI